MEPIQYIFIGSLTALTFLAVLFRLENKRGRRIFLVGARAGLDKAIRVISQFVEHSINYIGQGTVRKTSHLIIHRVLHVLLGFVRLLEAGLRQVQHKNRKMVESDQAHVSEKMSAISDHAASIKLSPEEKRKKRQEMLK